MNRCLICKAALYVGTWGTTKLEDGTEVAVHHACHTRVLEQSARALTAAARLAASDPARVTP